MSSGMLNFDMHYMFHRFGIHGIDILHLGKFNMLKPRLQTGIFS